MLGHLPGFLKTSPDSVRSIEGKGLLGVMLTLSGMATEFFFVRLSLNYKALNPPLALLVT